jgi:hypothetical protein
MRYLLLQLEIVEANKEKLMQMTPVLFNVLMVKCRNAKEDEVVELKATTGYSNDVFKLIIQLVNINKTKSRQLYMDMYRYGVE